MPNHLLFIKLFIYVISVIVLSGFELKFQQFKLLISLLISKVLNVEIQTELYFNVQFDMTFHNATILY